MLFSIDSIQLPYLDGKLDAVSDFYGRVVGLRKMAADGSRRLCFALGESTLSLSPVAALAQAVKPDYLAIRTDAFESMRDRLESAGFHPVCSLPESTPRVMYVKDPSGNQLAFLGGEVA